MPVIHERYRVIRELSETLYGWVFACEDLRSAPDTVPYSATVPAVVVKQVSLERVTDVIAQQPAHGHLPDDPIHEQQVADLVRCAGGHPNLVEYHEAFIEQKTLYLVMEYCADGDLYDYLSTCKHRRLSYTSALSVLSQVASGVDFLHECGIAHRDISLENIMLHRGRCKLGDFGLATRANRVRGKRVGKQYYMAPEVVAGSTCDPKAADVWSLGVVFFILITGSPIVPIASTSAKAFQAINEAGIRAVLQAWGVAAVLPQTAVDLLAGMLTINPQKRLTMKQVLAHEALAEWLDGAV